jgi:beta-lactamase class A
MRRAGVTTTTTTTVAVGCVLALAPPALTAPPSRDPERARACWSSRVAAAREYAATRPGDVAFAVVDSRGREWHAGGRRPFLSASLLKTTLLVAYLRQPSVRGRVLTADERRLLAPMIRRSDNTATNALLGRLTASRIRAAARTSGQRQFVLAMPVWGLSQTSAVDQARLFLGIDQALPARHRRYARRLLRTVVASQRWGLPRSVPRGWTLMFKGGWGSGTGRVVSQAGRIERDGRAVSLAVMTEGNPNHAVGAATIAGVASRLLAAGPRDLASRRR